MSEEKPRDHRAEAARRRAKARAGGFCLYLCGRKITRKPNPNTGKPYTSCTICRTAKAKEGRDKRKAARLDRQQQAREANDVIST